MTTDDRPFDDAQGRPLRGDDPSKNHESRVAPTLSEVEGSPNTEQAAGSQFSVRGSDHLPSSIVTSAPAKLILCGEHAVVYGRPAIALPLGGIRAHAEISAGEPGSGIVIHARNLEQRWTLAEKPADTLSMLVTSTLDYLAHAAPHASRIKQQALNIIITSDIPIASGMGSGASVATALVRALAQFFGHNLPNEQISALVFESEKRLHGTPSGIDNTVVAWEQPVWFVRKEEGRKQKNEILNREQPHPSSFILHSSFEPVAVTSPFTLLIGDTGVRSATRLPVGEVRQRWQADPARYEALFDQIGALVMQMRDALAHGNNAALGPLLNENHAALQEIDVSSPELDRLVEAAREAGALGAKLSGAGWGGVMLALVEPRSQPAVVDALHSAGATRVLATDVAANV